jgi:hypothetical protein
MKRKLRHPVRAIREPFGTAGLIVACIALIAAVGGTAWAASGLNAKQKKEVKAIAKKYAGKPGAPGPAGPAGTNGTNGKDGTNGAPGKDGTNVTFSPASEAACPSGGSVFKAANGETTVCNGETGFTESLPAEATETGHWDISVAGGEHPVASISFNIPLAAPLGAGGVHYIEHGSTSQECPGTVEEPEAESGNLCVYEGGAAEGVTAGVGLIYPTFEELALVGEAGTLKSGAVLFLLEESGAGEEERHFADGSWAVTG